MNTTQPTYFIAPRYDRGPPTEPLELDLSDGGNKIAAKIRRELIRQKICGADGRAEALRELEKL
jgi:hypothetical protein